MPHKPTGQLVGNVPNTQYDSDSPSNAGAFTPAAHPSGARLVSWGEGASSAAFNRALVAASRNSDHNYNQLRKSRGAFRVFDSTEVADLANTGDEVDLTPTGWDGFVYHEGDLASEFLLLDKDLNPVYDASGTVIEVIDILDGTGGATLAGAGEKTLGGTIVISKPGVTGDRRDLLVATGFNQIGSASPVGLRVTISGSTPTDTSLGGNDGDYTVIDAEGTGSPDWDNFVLGEHKYRLRLKTIAGGPFDVGGETITGGTSTAIATSTKAASDYLEFTANSTDASADQFVDFQIGETVTGGTSGATGVVVRYSKPGDPVVMNNDMSANGLAQLKTDGAFFRKAFLKLSAARVAPPVGSTYKLIAPARVDVAGADAGDYLGNVHRPTEATIERITPMGLYLSGLAVSDGGSDDVDIAAGRLYVNGRRHAFSAASNVVLTTNNTYFIYFDASTGLFNKATTLPLPDPENDIPLAKAVLTGAPGGTVAVSDLRVPHKGIYHSPEILVGSSSHAHFSTIKDAVAVLDELAEQGLVEAPIIRVISETTETAKISWAQAGFTITGARHASIKWGFDDTLFEPPARTTFRDLQLESTHVNAQNSYNRKFFYLADNMDHVTIQNVRTTSSGTSCAHVYVDGPTSGNGPAHLRLLDCDFSGASDYGIRLERSGVHRVIKNVTIEYTSHNGANDEQALAGSALKIEGSRQVIDGVQVVLGGAFEHFFEIGCTDSTISGAVGINCKSHGMVITGSQNHISAARLDNCGVLGETTVYGIHLNGGDENTIEDSFTSVANGTTKKGLRIESGSDGNTFRNCDWSTQGIDDQNLKSSKWDMGFINFHDSHADGTDEKLGSGAGFQEFTTHYTIPADTLKLGSIIDVDAKFNVNGISAAETLTVRTVVDGIDSPAAATYPQGGSYTAVLADEIMFNLRLHVSAIGASGAVDVVGHFGSAQGQDLEIPFMYSGVVNTTTDTEISFEAMWTGSSASDKISLRLARVRVWPHDLVVG